MDIAPEDPGLFPPGKASGAAGMIPPGRDLTHATVMR